MDRGMFANFNSHRISLNEAKRISNTNGNTYSDEELKKIVDYRYALAELQVEHAEKIFFDPKESLDRKVVNVSPVTPIPFFQNVL